ncbi:MAG: hypothetical protein AB7G15_03235 [Alphaproteobacteria bacterium]
MRKMGKMLLTLVAVILLASPAVAAEKQYRRAGTIEFDTKSAGFIVGYEWGYGWVTLNNGQKVRVRVRALNVGMIGFERISAVGTVYNLDRVSDLDGKYAGLGAGVTIGGGVAGAAMQNARGVIIELRETAQGIAAKIAASGIDVAIHK